MTDMAFEMARDARKSPRPGDGASVEQADKVGARRRQTRRAGPVWAKSIGLRLDRTASAFFAEALDLVPNHRRQNGSI
jgi:hypothetical protein